MQSKIAKQLDGLAELEALCTYCPKKQHKSLIGCNVGNCTVEEDKQFLVLEAQKKLMGKAV